MGSVKYDPHLLNWLLCHYQTETVAAILYSIKAHAILNAHFIELNVLILRYRSPWAPDGINSETTEK